MNCTEAYRILGLKQGANLDDIKKALRQKALRVHPDKNKSANAAEEVRKLYEARDFLLNNEIGVDPASAAATLNLAASEDQLRQEWEALRRKYMSYLENNAKDARNVFVAVGCTTATLATALAAVIIKINIESEIKLNWTPLIPLWGATYGLAAALGYWYADARKAWKNANRDVRSVVLRQRKDLQI